MSILAATNVPVKVIQERLGHATLGFTLARYAHVLPRAQAEAAKLFSEAIGD